MAGELELRQAQAQYRAGGACLGQGGKTGWRCTGPVWPKKWAPPPE